MKGDEYEMDDALRQRLGLPEQADKLNGEEYELPGTETQEVLVLKISREDVEKGRMESYLREFKKIEKKKLRGQVSLVFTGYEADVREVYQIREITNWIERLLKNIPYLFYFLSRDNYSMRIAFFCLSEVVGRSGIEVSITKDQGRRLIEKLTKSAITYSRKAKDPAAVQFAVAEEILEELGYEQTLNS